MTAPDAHATPAPPLLTDGGLETVLIFHEGLELPAFAAFPLLDSGGGRETLRAYFRRHLDIAAARGLGFVLQAPTWRSNARWGSELGYAPADLDRLNRDAVALMRELRDEYAGRVEPMVVSGCVGPYDDGYRPAEMLGAAEAEAHHAPQIRIFADAGVDVVTAMTITYVDEAVGIVRAAVAAGVPVVISFTVETDGRLPSGASLADAVRFVDAATDAAAEYYMVNCAHPTHFAHVLAAGEGWTRRMGGIRANASTRSHAELDAPEDLDDGDPVDLGARYRDLVPLLPGLRVVGGCCGTDHRHVDEIARAVTGAA